MGIGSLIVSEHQRKNDQIEIQIQQSQVIHQVNLVAQL